jgi:acetate kinase
MKILILNAGSSSIKYKLFEKDGQTLTTLIDGMADAIGQKTSLWKQTDCISGEKINESRTFENHEDALTHITNVVLKASGSIEKVGHRVVHGGNAFSEPTIINDDVFEKINAISFLAPLHNPANLLGIRIARKILPNALHVAIFDTAFHHGMPEKAALYALDRTLAKELQIKRYGFHGTSHEYVARKAANYLKKPFDQCNFITFHLGNGASVCLIHQGKSVDTSMGMTPLEGLIMGTRCGDLDPAILLYLQKTRGYTYEDVDTLLNKQSGLKGLTGTNDMRDIEDRLQHNDPAAMLAIDMTVYRLQKYLGAYAAVSPQLDAIIFTGGIGENSDLIREKMLTPPSLLNIRIDAKSNQTARKQEIADISAGDSAIKTLVIKTNEELFMAQSVMTLD